MNWDNLLKNNCPDCNLPLVRTMVKSPAGTIGCKCGMIVKQERYQAIISNRTYIDHDNE